MLTRKVSLGLISVFLAGFALGGEAIPNWAAPSTWRPARAHTGLTTMGDVTNPLPFIGADPCRIADTRGNGFAGAYGPPSLSQGSPRNFTLTGQCGIPALASAVSLNVTVTNTQGPGFILIYPAGGTQPTVSTLNYVANQTIANAAVVPLGAGGAVTVIAGVSGTDLILDTNGYYASAAANPIERFGISGSFPGGGIIAAANSDVTPFSSGVQGSSAPAGLVFGVDGDTTSASNGAAGVRGVASATTGAVFGVDGQTTSTTNGAAGVRGDAFATAGAVYGVAGFSSAIGVDGAGVNGVDASGPPAGSSGGLSGVRGDSKDHIGVLGKSQLAGVLGVLRNSAGGTVALGFLGYALGTAGDSTTGPWGVFAGGTLGATGAKHFVEPHPSDASKVILYSSLEGREVGTYFRGTARTVREEAVIEVPEDFRIVTDEEGLTVQLTPMGDLAILAVIRKGLDRIVVRSSKDVTFDYLIQGVRRAFKDFEPVAKGMEFAPRSAQDRMPGYLTEEAKRRLIANGTYNADGTVNMDTAERLGWVKMWADREAQAKAAAAANTAAHAGGWAERK